ncbi:hypothetical protein HOLleu_29267 [Holothuria leucospilota]|uniref:Ig-like domain-containing protein n=1 Tax=Holothuria leucospilota TaxID=206669 RepID=A0A9Q1BNF1_HOLLE|nr:hypothetical protein HOLleu_29267 [Holothuria leucospilota]
MHSERSQVPLERDYLSCGAIYQSLSSEDLQAFHQYLKRTSDIDLQDPEEHSQRTSDIEFQTKMTIKATNGATVTLPCEATDAKDVMWIKRTQQGKNNLIYLGGHTFGSTDDFVYSNGNLAIAELGELHQGLYITTSLQQFQDNSVATAYNVICDESCRYINYTVDYGSTIILPVDYSLRNESDKVKWSTDSFYGDITETGNKGKYNLQQNGNLLIRHVDDNDNCIFHCKLYDSIIYYSVTVKSEPVYR